MEDPLVEVDVRRVKAGYYKADGPFTDAHYTIRKQRTGGWKVLTGYGNAKKALDAVQYQRSLFSTKRDAVAEINKRESLEAGAQTARKFGMRITKKKVPKEGELKVAGFGGQRWVMMTRIQFGLDSEWINEMEFEGDIHAELARRTQSDAINKWHVKGLLWKARQEYLEENGVRSAPWEGQGGAGLRTDEKLKFVIE